ncbi:GIY-YIG nuclease family protein [Nocardiopsis composta]
MRRYDSGMKVIYKITYPNGKIYIGSDRTDSRLTYFGSPSKEVLERDFDRVDLQDFWVRKQILWQSETATTSEVLRWENELIIEHGANDPGRGYNRRPAWRQSD